METFTIEKLFLISTQTKGSRKCVSNGKQAGVLRELAGFKHTILLHYQDHLPSFISPKSSCTQQLCCSS